MGDEVFAVIHVHSFPVKKKTMNFAVIHVPSFPVKEHMTFAVIHVPSLPVKKEKKMARFGQKL